MAKKEEKTRAFQPSTTIEGRENQLISLAVDLAETQMREGTASAQVISHYLKLGSTREGLEQARLQSENALLQAKVENLASAGRIEALYKNALTAFSTYSGQEVQDGDEIDYDD